MRISEIKKMTKTRKILKIGKIKDVLTEKEYKILCLRFGLDGKQKGHYYTQNEIRWLYYKRDSVKKIGRIEKQALEKVWKYIDNLPRKLPVYERVNGEAYWRF